MGEFVVGVIISAWIFMLTVHNTDLDADALKNAINKGESICQSHGGLESFDYGDDFTCKNGLIIQATGGKQ